MAFRSIGGSRVIGQGNPQDVPIQLDPAPYEGAVAYGSDGLIYVSNGTAWNPVGAGPQGTTGIQGDTGVQGVQGTYGPGFTIIGSVPNVNVAPPNNPQTTLNAAFPSANIGEGVIDDLLDELWIFDGTVWVNIGSFRGVQGFQGVQGVQGLQGTIGEEGIQGSRGFRGFQGVQGLQGTTGIQGTQGIQGLQGTQGAQGPQGTTGIQGDTGIQGTQGVQGVQGPQGTTGIQGDTGIQGIAGDFGGLSYDFTYDNNTANSDPGTGKVRFSSTNMAAPGLVMYIDDQDDGGVTVTDGIMTELAGVAGPVKGYMKIVNGANIYDQATFRIDAPVTDATPATFWRVSLTFISGSTAFTNGTDFRISFVRNGEQGVQGLQGIQGTTGIQGDTGIQGTQGPQSTQGTQGVQGDTGTQGLQGVQGVQGVQGIQGVQGDTGTQGVQGVQGDTGIQGVQGVQGDFGPQGIQGSRGLQGYQGTTGIQGGTGVQGIVGYNGGLTFEWNFNTNTSISDPGASQWKINSVNAATATKLTIDDVPLNNFATQLDELFDYLQNKPNVVKGQIIIASKQDNDGPAGHHFIVYEFTNFVWDSVAKNYGTFDVTYVQSSNLGVGNNWSNVVADHGAETVINFIPQGEKGTQGVQGIQGTRGIQGLRGLQGTRGLQGVQGVQGDTGVQGAQGVAGSFGGASFEYDFTPDVTPTGPATARFKFNNTNITTATVLRLSSTDTTGTNISAYLATIANSTSAIKAYVKLISIANPSVFVIYGITASTQVSTYFNMTVTYLSKSASMDATYLTNNTDTIVSFAESGDAGVQGVQGLQGTTGVQGDTGLQGTTGAGTQGVQGVQGDLGFQGVQGFPGPIGPQGVQGADGIQGGGGLQGITGGFGGITFDYTYSINIAASDPGSGILKFNNATLSSATTLYIDDRDDNFVDIQPFLRTIDDSTSPIKGHYKVSEKLNPQNFVIFTIASLTEQAGYFQVSSAFVSGSVTNFANSADITITFARTGDIGPRGNQGIQGFEGFQGPQGVDGGLGIQGIQGPQGIQGGRGLQGRAGFIGGDGTQGSQGVQGTRGLQGVAGADGDEGFQGVQGVQGRTGAGAQGLQGTQGVKGNDGIGAVGIQGFQGVDGNQGTQGIQGTRGLQGRFGLQGANGSGNQGTQGLQGEIGEGQQGTQGMAGSGLQGSLGIQGIQGPDGPQGIDGTGNQGTQGFQGPAGIGDEGLQGDTGFQGIQGIAGDEGGSGVQGIQGIQSAQGVQGIAGGAGEFGIQGIQGVQGDFGPQGPSGAGIQGPQSTQGIQGRRGVQGPLGAGSQGTQGHQGIQGDIGIQGFPGQGTQGMQGTQAAQGFQGYRGYQGVQGVQGFGAEGAVKNLQNVHESGLQTTPLFLTMVEGGATERPLNATLGPNPGGESNFYYTSASDELTVENLQIEGNLTIVGTLSAATTTGNQGPLWVPDNITIGYGDVEATPTVTQRYISASNTFAVKSAAIVNQIRFLNSANTAVFDFSITTGNFIATGDVQSNSDERLKENVETIENALDKVSKLRGVYFDMKARPGVRKVGLIAQEVEEVLPEVVSTDSDGDKIKSVAYANMVGLLVEAIKELKDEVDHLKGQ
jgi:hypothetical protein